MATDEEILEKIHSLEIEFKKLSKDTETTLRNLEENQHELEKEIEKLKKLEKKLKDL